MKKAANSVNIALTKRDIGLLLMVYNYDGCAIAHLANRFWKSGTKKFGPRSAFYRRIRLLVDAGYLRSARLPPLNGNGGSGKAFITLGDKGRQVIADYLRLSRSDLRRLREIETPLMAAHHLEICSIRLALELACEQHGIELTEWRSERELRLPPIVKVQDPRPPAGSPAILIPLIPDGEFSLRLPDGRTGSLRLECDRGTVAPKRVRARCRAYFAYTAKDARPVLWVVPDQARRDAITSWALAEAGRLALDPTLFWITTKDQVNETTILEPIWQVVGGPLMALVPAPGSSTVPVSATSSTLEGEERWNF